MAKNPLNSTAVASETGLSRKVRFLSLPRTAYALLFLLILGYILFYTWMSWHLHATFITSADDLSNVDQVVWNSQHGRLLERTTGTRSVPRYGEHVEPIWIALGLLYVVWDDVRALLLAQTVALALGALPVFWFARDAWRRYDPDYSAGLLFATLYLLNPFVSRANIAEVHATPFAITPMLLALYWGWTGRWARVVPMVLLVLLVREDMGLLVVAFGGWEVLRALVAGRKAESEKQKAGTATNHHKDTKDTKNGEFIVGAGETISGRGTQDAGTATHPLTPSEEGGPINADALTRPPLDGNTGRGTQDAGTGSTETHPLTPSEEGGPINADALTRPPLDGNTGRGTQDAETATHPLAPSKEGGYGNTPSAAGSSYPLSAFRFPLSRAVALIASGALALAIMVFGIIGTFADERFSGQDDSIFLERYAAFGDSPVGIVVGMLTRWDLWAQLLSDPYRLNFLRDFTLATGGLGLFAPLAWVLFLPHFLLNLLSDYFGQYGGLQHYGAPLVPGMMVAAILGGAQLWRWGRYHPLWRVLLFVLALGGAGFTARTATGQPLAADWITPVATPHHQLLARFVAQIPPDAPLSADPQLHPHLAHRYDAYRFPTVGENAEWILVDVTTNTTRHPADLKQDIEELLAAEWGIADGADGYLLLQKGNPTKTIPAEFYTFAHTDTPPEVPLGIALEGVTIEGYTLRQDFWGRVSVEWSLRPTAPIPADVRPDAALLTAEGNPIPDTVDQPMPALLWQPVSTWQVGQTYHLRTLPRHPTSPFIPALILRNGESVLAETTNTSETVTPSPVLRQQVNGWWQGGTWTLQNNHAERGTEGWRLFAPPMAVRADKGTWAFVELAGWEIEERESDLQLTLLWHTPNGNIPAVQRFVHLVPSEGAPVPMAQSDGPLGGAYPASQWAAGEWVQETITLPRPAEGSAWRLLVGLYDPANGQRFAVSPDAGDGTFEVR